MGPNKFTATIYSPEKGILKINSIYNYFEYYFFPFSQKEDKNVLIVYTHAVYIFWILVKKI